MLAAVKLLANSKCITLRLKSDVLGGTRDLLLWTDPDRRIVNEGEICLLGFPVIGSNSSLMRGKIK
jgi:hypothetical protein